MSVRNVGNAGGGSFIPLELDGDFTTVAGRLAVLMLEGEETQQQLARESMASAREAYSTALANEVATLRDQADATRLGAVVTGGLGLVSSGFGVSGALRKCDRPWESELARGCSTLAGPLGDIVGHDYGAADAKSAQGAREQASWEIDDLRRDIEDADAVQDKALDWVSGLIAQDAAITTAILSSKA